MNSLAVAIVSKFDFRSSSRGIDIYEAFVLSASASKELNVTHSLAFSLRKLLKLPALEDHN